MLELTLSTTFEPGANRKGAVTGAGWLFLRPTLRARTVVCLGRPSAATRAALESFGDHVTIVDGPVPSRFGPGSVDLLVVLDRGLLQRYRRDPLARDELAGLLALGGTMWLDGIGASHPESADTRSPGTAFTAFTVFPARGELLAAVPAGHDAAAAYLASRGLTSAPPASRFARLRHAVRGERGSTARPSRAALLVPGDDNGPPAYLRRLADAAGVDLGGRRWCLAAPGRYSSRKVLLFVLDVAGRAPEFIVKLVRTPAANARLHNEAKALRTLAALGLADRAVAPEVVFAGQHDGIAIVGETVVDGVPFRSRPLAQVDGAPLDSALRWFDVLAELPSAPPAAGTEVAGALEQLLERFLEIYAMQPRHEGRLRDQLDALRAVAEIPVVFQHGDPGPWNLLITADDRVALLDWEAAELHGVVLWDLLYFLRSHSVDHARSHGVRGALDGFAQQFLADTPVSRLAADAIERYCERTSLDARAVEPLFHLCWMHRSLKEATRMAPADVGGGHYVNLLRRCIDEADTAPTLRRLFSRRGSSR